MELPKSGSRLIVNADDFGRSHSINQAVIRAHRDGILTSASLMVNEEACAEAIELAREHSRLGVGLHLTLVCGHSALPHNEISGLVNERREFSNNPIAVGLRYFFNKALRRQLTAEIAEQFRIFKSTGLPLDHVNGHLHLHLHPVVFSILMEHAHEWGITHLRWTRDRFWLNARVASGHWFYRFIHAVTYQILSARSLPEFQKRSIKHTKVVFGLLQNERVDEEYLLKLLPQLGPGESEVYSHPSLDQYKNEFDALISPRVLGMIKQLGISLIRYRDL